MSEAKKLELDLISGPRIEEELDAPDADFTFVRIAELYSPRRVAFDLFLRLGEGKYLRIFRAGENFDEAALKLYETERGMRYVYFERAHRATYINASLALMQKLSLIAGVPLRTKFGVARILGELYVQSLLECEEDALPRLLDKGRDVCATLASWIDSQAGLDKFFFALDQIDNNVPAHAFLTGIFSCLVANQMPWKSKRTNETLLMAAFLCDIGYTALSPEVVRLKPKRMNPAQKRQFEKHPEASFLILSDVKSTVLNQNVLSIVREHHEYCDGSGFPRALSGNQILMLSKVIVLCGDGVRTASDFLLPPGDALRLLFPDTSEKIFEEAPEVVAKYDHDLLVKLFQLLNGGGA